MPAETKDFAMFPHDWHSADYVAEWIARDVTRDPERRSLLQRMLSFAPFPREAVLDVLDVGAGYGVVGEEVLQAFPSARITLQDYSGPMLDRARQRLGAPSDRLRYVLCDLTDPSWPKQAGGPFDLAVSAIALHNLRDPEKIFACYRAIHDLLKPHGCFLKLRPLCRWRRAASGGAARSGVRPCRVLLARVASGHRGCCSDGQLAPPKGSFGSRALERPSEAQLVAVGIGNMEEALAPFRVARRRLDPVAGGGQPGI
jgi:SAM-dependent methyltransferase